MCADSTLSASVSLYRVRAKTHLYIRWDGVGDESRICVGVDDADCWNVSQCAFSHSMRDFSRVEEDDQVGQVRSVQQRLQAESANELYTCVPPADCYTCSVQKQQDPTQFATHNVSAFVNNPGIHLFEMYPLSPSLSFAFSKHFC